MIILTFGVLLASGIVAAIFMATFIGANDIANAMGPLIGSGAMKLWKVLILAAVFEFIGSVLLGGFVSNTVSGGLIHIPVSPTQSPEDQVREFMLAMVSVLVGSGTWLCIATLLSLPVSTTHSVIGSVVGVGIFMAGWNSVDWYSLGRIVLTWVTSPVIGGITSVILWYLLRKFVMHSRDPIPRMIHILPFLSFITVGIMALFLLYKGLTPFNLEIPIYIAAPVSLVVSGILAVIVWRFGVPYVKKQIDQETTSTILKMNEQDQELDDTQHNDDFDEQSQNNDTGSSNEYTISGAVVASSEKEEEQKQQEQGIQFSEDQKNSKPDETDATTDIGVESLLPHAQNNNTTTDDTNISVREDTSLSQIDITEKFVFQFLVIMTSACIAVAHGANDISNASGPLTAIVYSFQTRRLPDDKAKTLIWITAVTAVGLIFGLATLGYKVMQTIGTKITKLTPARAFVSQLSTATITLTASLLGLPLSTTHIVVGCIYGIGLVDDYKNLQWRLILGIISSWIVTIPAAAILTLIVFAVSRLIL